VGVGFINQQGITMLQINLDLDESPSIPAEGFARMGIIPVPGETHVFTDNSRRTLKDIESAFIANGVDHDCRVMVYDEGGNSICIEPGEELSDSASA
jgi:hypothetical protein